MFDPQARRNRVKSITLFEAKTPPLTHQLEKRACMYTLVSAIGKSKTPGSRWTSIDIAQLPLADLYRDYEEVYAVLSNPFFATNRTLILSQIKEQNAANTFTLPDLLSTIDDEALPTTDDLYHIETSWAKYSDAFRARYKVEPISPIGHIGSTIPASERNWLSLSRRNTDYHLFHKSCLVTINGLIHRTDTDGERVYVVDGMKSCRHSGMNQIGITSFREIGDLEFVPITDDMVHRRYVDEPLSERVYLDIGQPKPGKLPMLVLGGYLHLLDERTFFQISDTLYAFSPRNIPWRERYFESKPLIDLSGFELEVFNHNENQVSETELFSDSVIRKYFTLSQSFLVFVNCDHIFSERHQLKRTVLPNMYTSHTEPSFPLLTGYGKLSDYWKTKEDGQWAINIADGIRWNYSFNTAPEPGLISYDSSSPPYNPLERTIASFWKIGSDKIVLNSQEV